MGGRSVTFYRWGEGGEESAAIQGKFVPEEKRDGFERQIVPHLKKRKGKKGVLLAKNFRAGRFCWGDPQ